MTRDTGRRRVARARRRLKVTLPHCRSFTTDIGVGGFSAEVLRVLPTGTRLQGAIHLADRDVPFDGSVAWSRPGDAHLGIRGRMGIAFSRHVAELGEFVQSAAGHPSSASSGPDVREKPPKLAP